MSQPLKTSQKASVIGLGNMGSALADALLKAGHDVTIWNRTHHKADALRDRGASEAPDVRAAVSASPIVVLCLTDYGVGLALLEEAVDVLGGRTVVQFTAGTPEDARDMAGWCEAHGAGLLEGMVMVYPSAVGTDGCRIVYAGEREVFERMAPLLQAFGGQQLLVGGAPGAVSSIAMGALEFYYVGLFGFVHAATLARRAGVDAGLVLDELLAMQVVVAEGMRDAAFELDAGRPLPAKATIDLGKHNLGQIVRTCEQLGVSSALPEALLEGLRNAVEAGLGGAAIAAVREVLLRPTPHET